MMGIDLILLSLDRKPAHGHKRNHLVLLFLGILPKGDYCPIKIDYFCKEYLL